MNSNKDYKKLYNKYKLKYLALKKKFTIEEDNLNVADNMLSFLNSSEEFNQIGGTYMKHNDEYFNRNKILNLVKSLSIPIIDIHEAFTNVNDPLKLWLDHPNEYGYRIAAEHIYNEIKTKQY